MFADIRLVVPDDGRIRLSCHGLLLPRATFERRDRDDAGHQAVDMPDVQHGCRQRLLSGLRRAAGGPARSFVSRTLRPIHESRRGRRRALRSQRLDAPHKARRADERLCRGPPQALHRPLSAVPHRERRVLRDPVGDAYQGAFVDARIASSPAGLERVRARARLTSPGSNPTDARSFRAAVRSGGRPQCKVARHPDGRPVRAAAAARVPAQPAPARDPRRVRAPFLRVPAAVVLRRPGNRGDRQCCWGARGSRRHGWTTR